MFYASFAIFGLLGGLAVLVLCQAVLIILRDDQKEVWTAVEDNLTHVLRCEFLLRCNGKVDKLTQLRIDRPAVPAKLESLAERWEKQQLLIKGLLTGAYFAADLIRYANQIIDVLEYDDAELSALVHGLRERSKYRISLSEDPNRERLQARSWLMTEQDKKTIRARIEELGHKANFDKPRRLIECIARYNDGSGEEA